MLSFIVIGRNEGRKLTCCLESIYKTIVENNLVSYEVIYVDSKSTDDSIERAKQFKNLKIIHLIGDFNAAIARNIGAKESLGEELCFLDGDMELIPEMFATFYTEEKKLFYPFLSGDWINYFYSQDWVLLDKDSGLRLKKDVTRSTVGGLFFIKRSLWENVGGMRVKFKRSQDIDLALRLAKQGNLLLRKKELLAYHHMISYLDKNRKWKLLFAGADLYGRSYLYRKNFLNKYCLKRMIRNDYSALILLMCIIAAFFLNSMLPFAFFFLILLLRIIRMRKNHFSNYFYFIIRDIIVLFGVLFFWPKKPNNLKYSIETV